MRNFHLFGPYLLRPTAIAVQLITVAVLPNLLSVSDLGSYFLLVALVSSLIPLLDVGFIRYSYKYINRYGIVLGRSIVRRTGASLAVSLPICIAFLYIYLHQWNMFCLSLLYLFGLVMGRFLQINKYLFVVSSRSLAAATFDSLSTMLLGLAMLIAFLVSLMALNGREFSLWFIVSLSPMVFLVVYLLSNRYLSQSQYKTASPWLSFTALGDLRNLVRSMRRTWPVAVDAFLVSQLINLPILILGVMTQPEYLMLVGLFTRIFAAYATIVSVFPLLISHIFTAPLPLS